MRDLDVGIAHLFRDQVLAALTPDIKVIEVDLARTESVDGWGLGVLVALYKAANTRSDNVTFRLCSPRPSVQQLLELTRLHHLYEIIPASEASDLRPAFQGTKVSPTLPQPSTLNLQPSTVAWV